MNFREKIVVQTVISLMIFAGIKSAGMIDVKLVNKTEAFFSEQYKKHYTPDTLKDVFSDAYENISEAHKTVTAAVVNANKQENDDNVLGTAGDNGIQVVYAAAGGKITNAGISKEKGYFVEVITDDYIYTYGNLAQISVVPEERVRKGDIIGTYDNNEYSEFFFEKAAVL